MYQYCEWYVQVFTKWCEFDLTAVFRYLLNPALHTDDDLELFKFLGILLGVAVRTKKPLDLYLAPMVWKQLAGMPLAIEDLEEVRQQT